MAAPIAPDEILDVNRRYHDVAAEDYDAKWGISFGDIGRRQVLGKVAKLLAVFELEKAVYELRYELNNRPDWVGIPVAGIERLLEDEGEGG